LCKVHSFIGSYILHMNIMCWNMFDTQINVFTNEMQTYEWMNECHMNFASSYEFVYQMHFQCTILMCKIYELWINEFCTISISKSWDVCNVRVHIKRYIAYDEIFLHIIGNIVVCSLEGFYTFLYMFIDSFL
jgi:hypothetical protein